VLFALKICSVGHQSDMAGLVRTILKGKEKDENLGGVRDRYRRTLLHHAARHLGEVLSGVFGDPTAKSEDILHLIRDLVKGGSGLHALTVFRETPMLEVLRGYLENASPDSFIYRKCSNHIAREAPPMPFRIWLKQLKDSGVDLVKYGKQEQRLLEHQYAARKWRYWEHQKKRREELVRSHLHLINFTYAPEPADWKF